MKLSILFSILLLISCTKTDAEPSPEMIKALISYSFVQKYSTDTTLINTVFYDYLDSVQIKRPIFYSVLNQMNSDINFRKKIMTTVVSYLDSTEVINSQYHIYKKIQALRNDSLSF